MKRIALVIPSLGLGGMERVMMELANYFSKNDNVDIHLIILSQSEIFYNISPKIIFYKPKYIYSNWVINMLNIFYYLRKTLIKLKPDTILSFGEMYNSFVLIASIKLDSKVFVSDRSKPDKNWGYIHKYLRKKLYPKATGIISQTLYSKKYLSSFINNKNIKVIPNPVQLCNSENHIKKNIILSVGRLIKTKKIDLLLEIFSEINTYDWELWIVGDGNEKNNLEQKAIDLKIEEKVVFWGKQKNINEFYFKSKIFAFTSISEGFPNALLEAMSIGLACISFDCVAGPSDIIIDNYNGFLIEELNKYRYKIVLQQLIESRELREKISKNAVKTSKDYSINIIGDQYFQFILS